MKDDRFSWVLARLLYNRSDLVLAPSRTLVAELVRHGIMPPSRFQTNGIDLTEFAPKVDYLPSKRVVHVGRLGYEKHADVVVRAFALFAGDHPDWKLHVLGEGPAKPYLVDLTRELELGSTVEWSGFIDRDTLARAYRDADIFATASTIETQGIVVLEAMASGTPIVGVNALAVPEMAENERDGIIVEPYDAEAMARAFSRLADDDGLRERMGRAARESVKAHRLVDAIDGLEHVYATVAQGLTNGLGDRSRNGIG